MSSGDRSDPSRTQAELRKPTGFVNGQNWLRHMEGSQAGMIDTLLLKGQSTREDIARELNKHFGERPIKAWLNRVNGHLGHLQRSSKPHMQPHQLTLEEVNGKVRFKQIEQGQR